MNFEKNIQWSKSFEKNKNKEVFELEKEHVEIVLKEEIRRIEGENSFIGQGKAGKVCEIKGTENQCLKIIENKKASINNIHREMKMLDSLFLSKISLYKKKQHLVMNS